MYEYKLEISDIVIKIETEIKLIEEECFERFFTESKDVKYRVSFKEVKELPFIPDAVYEDKCYRVHKIGNSYMRSFFDAPRDFTPYAVAEYDYNLNTVEINYLSKGEECVEEFGTAFFYLGIEGILMNEDRFFLHASFIKTSFGGLLFSGPSGAGKSTQADLWCKYADARLINGDRPVLGKKCDKWNAWGAPYAGSSKCFINENYEISAIIILKKAQSCNIRRLNLNEAYKKIYSGFTVNSWNSEFCVKAFDAAVSIANDIPVYEYECTPDFNAVSFLKERLLEDRII